MKNIIFITLLTISSLSFGQKESRLDTLVSDLNLIASVSIHQQQFDVKKNGFTTVVNKDNKEFQFHFHDLSFTYNFFGGLFNVFFFYKEKPYCKYNHNNLSDLMFRSRNDANQFIYLLFQIKAELGYKDEVSHQIQPGMICPYKMYAMGRPRSFGYLYFNRVEEADTLGNVEVFDVVKNEKHRYPGNVFQTDTFLIYSKPQNMRWEAYSSYDGWLHGLEIVKRNFEDLKPFVLNTNSHRPFNEMLIKNKAYKVEIIDGDDKQKGSVTLQDNSILIETTNGDKFEKYSAQLTVDAHHFIVSDPEHNKVWQVLKWDKKRLKGYIADSTLEETKIKEFVIYL